MLHPFLISSLLLVTQDQAASGRELAAEVRTLSLLGCLDYTEFGRNISIVAGDLGLSSTSIPPSHPVQPVAGAWEKEQAEGAFVVVQDLNLSRSCWVYVFGQDLGAAAEEFDNFVAGEGAPFTRTETTETPDATSYSYVWERGAVDIGLVVSLGTEPGSDTPRMIVTTFLTEADTDG